MSNRATMRISPWNKETDRINREALEAERNEWRGLAEYYYNMLENLHSSLESGVEVHLAWGVAKPTIIQKVTQETEVKDEQ